MLSFFLRPNLLLFVVFSCSFCSIIRQFPKGHANQKIGEQNFNQKSSQITDDRSDYSEFDKSDGLLMTDEFPDNVLVSEVLSSDQVVSANQEMVDGVLCNLCPPGYGLVEMCTKEKITVCEPCKEGLNFSHSEPHFKPCTPCSHCGDGMYTEIECTPEFDTFCDSCNSAKLTILGARSSATLQSLNFMAECYFSSNEWQVERADERLETDSHDDDFIPADIVIEPIDDVIPTTTVQPVVRRPAICFSNGNPTTTPMPPVANDLSLDKLGSSLTGGFESRLLPGHLGLAEREFQRRPNVRRNVKRKSVSDTKSTTKAAAGVGKPELAETVDPDFAVESFLSQWLAGYDPSNKVLVKQASDQEALIFKPTNHDYPYWKLVHNNTFSNLMAHERRIVALAALIVIFLFLLLLSLIMFKMNRRRLAKKADRHFIWSTGLSELEDKVIRECAQKMNQSSGKRRENFYRRNPFDDENGDSTESSDGNIIDNPMEAFLIQNDQKVVVSQESLAQFTSASKNAKQKPYPGVVDV